MSVPITRRRLLGAAGAGLAAASVAGCGGADSGSAKTTLSFWQFYGTPDTPYGKPLQALFDRYMRANPQIRIDNRFIPFSEFNRTLLQSAAGGELPDIALVSASHTGVFAAAGVLADLSDEVSQWGKADAYYPSIWESTKWHGKNYGLPHVADCYVLWCNMAMFAEAGIEPPKTWAELTDTATRLTTKEHRGLAVSATEGVEGATAWMTRFLAAGGEITDIDSPAGRAALQQWVDLVDSGAMSRAILGWSEEDAYNRFRTGQAAMMINSATYVNILRDEAPDVEWTVTLLPKDEQHATFLSAENLTISSTADRSAAWDLLTYMQQPQVLNWYLPRRNKLPARSDVAAKKPWSTDPVWSVFVDQLRTAWTPPAELATKTAEMLTHVQAAVQAAVGGSSSVPVALTEAQRQIDGVVRR